MRPIEDPTVSQKRTDKQKFAKMIGEHLSKIRMKTGVSQEKLSMDAGYYHTYVNKIEKGKYSPSLHTIWRLSHALGISLGDFLKRF